jgi:hypothetical protein
MALTSTEIDECRHESGYASTRIGAEPYVAYAALFDVAIQPFTTDVGSTSVTPVAAAFGGARIGIMVAANPALPQKPNGLAFVPGARVNVDLGPSQELDVVLEAVLGTTLYLTLANAHGTVGVPYPVMLAGAEHVVRHILARLRTVRTELETIAPRATGVSAIDKKDVELFASLKGGRQQRSKYDELVVMRADLRDELCQALNVENLWRRRRSEHGGSALEPY